MTLLTIEETAKFEGVNYKTIYKRIERKKLNAIKCDVDNKKKEYRVKLDDLSEAAQKRYYASIKKEPLNEAEEDNPYKDMTLEDLTEEQRTTALCWQKIIEAYQTYVSDKKGKKTEATEDFVKVWNSANEIQITTRTLQRKVKLYKENGLIALADLRKQSSKKGETKIPDQVWSLFLQWWLDEAQPAVSTIYRNVLNYYKLNNVDILDKIPTEQTFYRQVKKLPRPVLVYFREGEKALDDKCMPYLRKVYENISSNEVWQSDYHTLDLFVKDDVTGKVFRPHVAAWIDVKSRKILSVVLCENSNSDGVILSFRKAAEKCGLPEYVYLDNGKEYLVHDFGGRGRRKTDEKAEYGSTILDRCGVKMYNAKVKNGKTKVIERIFLDVKNDFSKLISTYCGGKPEERPERMKSLTKNLKNVPLLSEVKRTFELYCEGIYNEHISTGEFMNKKTPNQVYEENLLKKRTATKEQLNLLLLRSERLQQVDRNGVYVRYGEVKAFYYSQVLAENYQKQKVFVRYNPEDMSEVRVYDEKERFITTAALSKNGGFDFEGDTDKEAIKELNHRKKAQKQAINRFVENLKEEIEAPNITEIVELAALKAIEENKHTYDAKVIEPCEFKQYQATGTDNLDVEIDLEKMAYNAKLKKGTEEN